MIEKDIPVYQITIDSFENFTNAGIDLISFVSRPAIITKGVMLAEEKQSPFEFKFSEEQMIVAGPVLIPDLKIYRYDEELGEYYVVFSKETIKKMFEKLNANPKKDLFNYEHGDNTAPAFLNGSWIIENAEFDKSKMYGFDLPLGTFFAEVKVTDKAFWETKIKGNQAHAFSIEGLMDIKMSELLKKNFELNRISFDVDGVLTTKEGRDMLQEEINKGSEVYIISARHTKENIFEITDEFNVPHSNIFAEGSNNAKIEKIKELNISKHYDDNQDVIDELGNIGYKFYINTISEEEIEMFEADIISELEFKSYTDYPEIENEQLRINQQDKIKLNKMKKRIKFSEYLTNDGVKISIEGEIMVGSPVFAILEDGTMEQMSEGEVMLEDGTILMIDAEGLIFEVKPAEVVVEEVEQSKDKKEEVKMQVTAEEIMPIINPILDEIRTMMAEMQSRIEMLEGNTLSDEIEVEMNKEKFNDIKFKFSNLRRLINE